MTDAPLDLVPGRSCDGCTMCCKLLSIDVLDKPRGKWCPHCNVKHGCTIYADRPAPCRSFHCGYLRIKELDELWKPAKAKFLINYEDKAKRIAIHVDPARPDAWRAEPYYSAIKDWARNAARDHGTVMVWTGDKAILVLPDRDKDLGAVREDQFVIPIEKKTARGVEVDYEVVAADDPRVLSSGKDS